MLEPPRPIRERIPFWRSSRFVGGVGVAAVHAGVIALLLYSMPTGSVLTPPQREVFFLFKPAPRPPKLPLKIEPQAPSKLATPLFQYRPPIVEGPSTEITAPPQSPTIGLSLFRCGPENIGNLTPEERSHCSGALEAVSFATVTRDHAHDAARWQRETIARNTPAQMPCTGADAATANGIVSGATVMVRPLCVAGQLLDALRY